MAVDPSVSEWADSLTRTIEQPTDGDVLTEGLA